MLGNFTDIVILLDASCSMLSVRESARQSLVNFIKDQQTSPEPATLTLVEFSAPEHFTYLAKSAPLSSFAAESLLYNPYGRSTALNKAWARLIDEQGQLYASLPESGRPKQVIFVVITDGYDNDSGHVYRADVNSRVTNQEKVYGWKFVYLAANQDAVQVGQTYGVQKDFALTYAANNMLVSNDILSNKVKTYRSTGTLTLFDASERALSLGTDNISKTVDDSNA